MKFCPSVLALAAIAAHASAMAQSASSVQVYGQVTAGVTQRNHQTGGGSITELSNSQFAASLLIISSRPCDMPANLQGLWADTMQPPWSSDYHANINLQMIYWPAETANLPECFEPLDRYIAFLTGPGAKTGATTSGQASAQGGTRWAFSGWAAGSAALACCTTAAPAALQITSRVSGSVM